MVRAFKVVLATTTAQTTMLSHGDSDHDDDETGRYSKPWWSAGAGDTVGALMVRIGFWGYYTIIIMRNPPKPYSNY